MNKLNKSIQNFQEYLEEFQEYIEKGAHLTRLAVQEPLGRSHERMGHYTLSEPFKHLFHKRPHDPKGIIWKPHEGWDLERLHALFWDRLRHLQCDQASGELCNKAITIKVTCDWFRQCSTRPWRTLTTRPRISASMCTSSPGRRWVPRMGSPFSSTRRHSTTHSTSEPPRGSRYKWNCYSLFGVYCSSDLCMK